MTSDAHPQGMAAAGQGSRKMMRERENSACIARWDDVSSQQLWIKGGGRAARRVLMVLKIDAPNLNLHSKPEIL